MAGSATLTWYGEREKKKLLERTDTAMRRSMDIAYKTVRQMIGSDVQKFPSRPGSPPNRRRSQGSYYDSFIKLTFSSKDGVIEGRMGSTNLDLTKFLEKGTTKMSARPHLLKTQGRSRWKMWKEFKHMMGE